MHLMLDLETYGITPGCAIFSIGAALFEPRNSAPITAEFYCEISLQSCLDQGLFTEQTTLDWWQAKGEIPNGTIPITQASKDFLLWVSNAGQITKEPITEAWANSPSFDFVILKAVVSRIGLQWPLPFWMERDVRTLKALAFPNNNYSLDNSHNALEDCKNQVRMVQAGYKVLNLAYDDARPNPFKRDANVKSADRPNRPD